MTNFSDLGKLLVVLGAGIVVLGLLLWAAGRLPFFGRLPGDINVQGRNGGFFFPIVSCLLLSVVLTVLLNLLLLLFRRH
jgi:hypothetical protein